MPSDNVIITNEEKLKETKINIAQGGAGKLQVVSDFDQTLISAFIGGEKVPSLMSILRDGSYLTPDYAQKAHALFEKYHPFETDPSISIEDKKKLMRKWWLEHYELLIQSGLSRKDLEKIAQSEKIVFRPGAIEFLDFLNEQKIPLLIISASGVGTETILLFFKRHNKLAPNIFIVSNEFIWGDSGRLASVKEPIIHTLNKDYAPVMEFPFYDKLEPRKNVILLGDSLDDINMVNGFDCENIIKIGFLNEGIDVNLPSYKEVFDAIILNDGPMDFVNSLLKELVL